MGGGGARGGTIQQPTEAAGARELRILDVRNISMSLLTRYWFEFEKIDRPTPANFGCGVTAYDYADAVSLLKQIVFEGEPLPAIIRVTPDVDVSKLENRHVLPNIGPVYRRGVWWPTTDAAR